MAHYAFLGTIQFELLEAPISRTHRHAAVWAEHEVLAGKPKLQAMGTGLDELTLSLRLHWLLGEVGSRYEVLRAALEAQNVLPLVLGYSNYVGRFVIGEMTAATIMTDSSGTPLQMDIELSLKEYSGEPDSALAQAIEIAGAAPIGSIIPKGLSDFVRDANKMLAKGISVARQVSRAVVQVKAAVNTAKMFADDPYLVFSSLRGVIGVLGDATAGLADIVGLGDSFKEITRGIRGASDFFDQLTELSGYLNTVYTQFNSGLASGELGDWFADGVAAAEAADILSADFAKSTQKMTAWIILRQDEAEEHEL